MKLKALRLAEVGPFTEPVALEGLSGGLDVLTGPNEIGKSTLFGSLGVLLEESHTTTARGVASLRPYAGGAPLIEADFEIGDRRLRLTKRYLAQRMAELTDLGSGQVWRGADAETAVAALLGSADRHSLRGFLSVAQGAGFALPDKPDASLTTGLAALIEREAADAAGAGSIRLLAASVKRRLDEMVTSRGKPKAGGEFDKAVRNHADLVQRLEGQRSKAALAAQRLDRWRNLRDERERLFDPAVGAELAAKAAGAAKAVAESDKALEQLRLASERVASRQMVVDRAKGDLDRHERACEEAAGIAAATTSARLRLQELAGKKAAATARLSAAQVALTDAVEVVEAARGELRQAQAAAEHRDVASRLADVSSRVLRGREAAAALATAKQRLSAIAVDDAGVEHLRRLSSRVEVLESRIAAETTRATISYLPGVARLIRIDGAELSDGGSISIDRRTEIVIEGVGRIVLEPGHSSGIETATERDRVMREMADGCSRMGVANLDQARGMLEARRAEEAVAAEMRSKLSALAPDGIEALEAAQRALAQRLEEIAPVDHSASADVATLQERIRRGEAEIGEHRGAIAALEREIGQAAAQIAGLDAQLAAAEKRRTELAAALPDDNRLDAVTAELVTALREAEAALSTVVREKSAWAESAPGPVQYEALVSTAKRAAADVATLQERRTKLDRELAELEGALSRDNEDGVGAEIAGLEEELSVAARRLADLQLDADALALLASRLERMGEDHRTRVLRPLMGRLEPLLGRLFEGARMHMEGPLLAVNLERGARTDPLQRVSGGTREQIATIVRIAYADMLAANGMELPLLLDDALVFSDDQRLEIMVGMLADAARRHQVVVLSCHQRALAPLFEERGANLLALSDWSEGRARIAGSIAGSAPTGQRSRAAAATLSASR